MKTGYIDSGYNVSGYIDSSVLLRIVFNLPGSKINLKKYKKLFSSELMLIECDRTVDRLRLENYLTDMQRAEVQTVLSNAYQSISIVEFDYKIILRARGSFPTVVKTLDAIHLSTALKCKEILSPELIFLTHDNQLKIAAGACMLEVEG